MKLSLPISNLDIRDTLSYQKCLVPKHKFPKNARPGQWAMCYFNELSSNEQYYAVCQIFPTEDLHESCYLDTSVTNYNHEEHYQERNLEKIMMLESSKAVANADVIFQLNPEFYIENSSLLIKQYLHEMAKTLLQKFQIVPGSLIRDRQLIDLGIDSIRLQIEGNYDGFIHITDKTNINVKDIYLKQQTLNRNVIPVDTEPFIQARQELENLMGVVRLRRYSQKQCFYLSMNTILSGAIGCGKTTLVEEFLRKHHCNVFRIKVAKCLKQYPGETESELRKIFKAAFDFEKNFKTNDPTVILLEEIHILCPHPIATSGKNSESSTNYTRICAQLLSLVDTIFTSRTNIMCLATTSETENLNEFIRRPGRFENDICIASLREDHRSKILKQMLNQSLPDINIHPALLETISKQTQGYVLADLALLVRNTTKTALSQKKECFENIMLDILKKFKPISLKGTDVIAYKTRDNFKSIGGMLELKKHLEVSIIAGLSYWESFKRFGLNLPKGVLLYGPPGCAKTKIAKCLATEANMTFIATSAAEVYSPYVGCAEKYMAKIFQVARKNSPCLIFLDEIDSLVGRRSIASSSNSSDVQARILSTLLTEMDGIISLSKQSSHIIVVAASNRPDMIDDALMRPGRFDKLIHVPAPDLPSRLSILDLYKNKMPFSAQLDLNYIAVQTENYSGADICNLCNDAALQAFQRDFNSEEITMHDFEDVLKTSKPSLVQSQIDWYYQFQNKPLL